LLRVQDCFGYSNPLESTNLEDVSQHIRVQLNKRNTQTTTYISTPSPKPEVLHFQSILSTRQTINLTVPHPRKPLKLTLYPPMPLSILVIISPHKGKEQRCRELLSKVSKDVEANEADTSAYAYFSEDGAGDDQQGSDFYVYFEYGRVTLYTYISCDN
jgi:hypothetical protein